MDGRSPAPPAPLTNVEAQSSNIPQHPDRIEIQPAAYDSLVILDTNIDEQINRFVQLTKDAEELPVSSAECVIRSLKEITYWMTSRLEGLRPLVVMEDSDLLLKSALLEKLSTTQEYMKGILHVLENRNGYIPHDFRGGILSTGNLVLIPAILY